MNGLTFQGVYWPNVAYTIKSLKLHQHWLRAGALEIARAEMILLIMLGEPLEKKILDQILGKGVYDPRIRPAGIYNNTGNIHILQRRYI